jgi:ATP-binding cassette subfamily B protein
MQLSMVFVLIPRAQASAVRINEVLALENSVVDPASPKDKLIDDAPTSLAFEHVDFRYEGAEALALHDINFKATAGQTVALIGGTGSGKSSFVNLIPRLYDIESGSIKLNGQDIRDITQRDLHAEISITQQKAVLFSGTVRSNLKYGKPDATEEEMWHALDLAQASEFIREQGGLDLAVEQDGDNFSGGQRQRLAIARTLIKDAPVYIFDDSFSALDFKTDAVLRAGLKEDARMQQAITVLVAQRISTVADADVIIVLEDGEVVGQGTHQELAANNVTYQEIIETQIKKGSEVDA